MTYNIKYTLILDDGSYEKEINVKNKRSEYEACSSLCDYLFSKYDNYKSHCVNSCIPVEKEKDIAEDDFVKQMNQLLGANIFG